MEITPEIQAIIDAQINETKAKWESEVLTPLQTQLAGLQPVTKSEQELALESKEKSLWDKEKNLTLKEHNLTDFAEFWIRSLQRIPKWYPALTQLETTKWSFFFLRS